MLIATQMRSPAAEKHCQHVSATVLAHLEAACHSPVQGSLIVHSRGWKGLGPAPQVLPAPSVYPCTRAAGCSCERSTATALGCHSTVWTRRTVLGYVLRSFSSNTCSRQ